MACWPCLHGRAAVAMIGLMKGELWLEGFSRRHHQGTY